MLINKSCNTLYGALIEPYFWLFVSNAVLFVILRVLVDEFLVPFCRRKTDDQENIPSPPLPTSAEVRLAAPPLPTSAEVRLAAPAAPAAIAAITDAHLDGVELGASKTVVEEKANVNPMIAAAGSAGQEKDLEGNQVSSSNNEMTTTTTKKKKFSTFFLKFQAVMSFVSFVVITATYEKGNNSWEGYTNWYGLIMNSSILQTAASCAFLFYRYDMCSNLEATFGVVNKENEAKGEQDEQISPEERGKIDKAADDAIAIERWRQFEETHDMESFQKFKDTYQMLGFAVAELTLCAQFTHTLPGYFCYCWVIVLALFFLFFVMVQIQRAVKHYFPHFDNWLFVEVMVRFTIIALYQTTFNYMALLYALPKSHTGQDYLNVISQEWALRSQTECFFAHRFDNGRNAMSFLSWL